MSVMEKQELLRPVTLQDRKPAMKSNDKLYTTNNIIEKRVHNEERGLTHQPRNHDSASNNNIRLEETRAN